MQMKFENLKHFLEKNIFIWLQYKTKIKYCMFAMCWSSNSSVLQNPIQYVLNSNNNIACIYVQDFRSLTTTKLL